MNDDKLLFYERKWLAASEHLNHKSCHVFMTCFIMLIILLDMDHGAFIKVLKSIFVDETHLVVFHVWDYTLISYFHASIEVSLIELIN